MERENEKERRKKNDRRWRKRRNFVDHWLLLRMTIGLRKTVVYIFKMFKESNIHLTNYTVKDEKLELETLNNPSFEVACNNIQTEL